MKEYCLRDYRVSFSCFFSFFSNNCDVFIVTTHNAGRTDELKCCFRDLLMSDTSSSRVLSIVGSLMLASLRIYCTQALLALDLGNGTRTIPCIYLTAGLRTR